MQYNENDFRFSAPEEQNEEKKKKTGGAVRELFDWIEVVVFSLAFVLILFGYCGRLAVVDGNSMNNTLENAETLVITNMFYTPQQGDIIVFQIPDKSTKDQSDAGLLGEPLVKRVIATGGQTVYIDYENWKTYVYDAKEYGELTIEQIKEKITPFEDTYSCDINYIDGVSMEDFHASDEPFVIEDGKLFVMGDNRNHSSDSRYYKVGQVDERYVLGKAILRITPFNKFGTLY